MAYPYPSNSAFPANGALPPYGGYPSKEGERGRTMSSIGRILTVVGVVLLAIGIVLGVVGWKQSSTARHLLDGTVVIPAHQEQTLRITSGDVVTVRIPEESGGIADCAVAGAPTRVSRMPMEAGTLTLYGREFLPHIDIRLDPAKAGAEGEVQVTCDVDTTVVGSGAWPAVGRATLELVVAAILGFVGLVLTVAGGLMWLAGAGRLWRENLI